MRPLPLLLTAEYPPASWVPAHETNYHRAGRVTFKRIVIHCTDGHPFAEPVAEMWQQPHHGSSAHFVVGQDGTAIQCVALADVAWHAHSANSESVGIEHCARTPGELRPSDAGLLPSDVQYHASALLVAWLCQRAGLAPSREVIVGHAEADPQTTHTRCPDGCGWDWERYMEVVQEEFDGLTAVAG